MKKSHSMGPCHVPEEILVEILCRLPRKSRCRFKSVSKEWFNLISNLNLIIPKTTNTGLLLHCVEDCKGPIASPAFLCLDNKGGVFANRSIRYNVRGYNMNLFYTICGSCNGFLLLRGLHPKRRHLGYLVYNPITKFLVEFAATSNAYRSIRVGLVFDRNHIKVVCVSPGTNNVCLIFNIYSLEDRQWKRKELEYPPGDLAADSSFSQTINRSLFYKDAMHWLMTKHLLIYHLKDEFLKIIKLPSANNSRYSGEKCIWQFEGRLHHCEISRDRVDIWILQMEEENYHPGQQCFQWKHMHSGVLAHDVDLFPSYLSPLTPFAFNEDFGILYIVCNGSVISYNPETGKQELAYQCPRISKMVRHVQHVGFPFLFTSDWDNKFHL